MSFQRHKTVIHEEYIASQCISIHPHFEIDHLALSGGGAELISLPSTQTIVLLLGMKFRLELIGPSVRTDTHKYLQARRNFKILFSDSCFMAQT